MKWEEKGVGVVVYQGTGYSWLKREQTEWKGWDAGWVTEVKDVTGNETTEVIATVWEICPFLKQWKMIVAGFLKISL